MRNIKILISLIFILSLTDHLFAQTQLEMNEAAYKEYQKKDAEMNVVYKNLIKILNKNEKVLLITAQKNWIKFRDSKCEFEGKEFEGGSIRPLVWANCLQECTESRIKDLKENIKSRTNH